MPRRVIAIVGATATGKTALAHRARAASRRRDHQRRLPPGLPRHGHRHGEADAGRAGARRRTTSSTSSTRTRPFTLAPFLDRREGGARRHLVARPSSRSSSAAPGSTSGRCSKAGACRACRRTASCARDLEALAARERSRSARRGAARSIDPASADDIDPRNHAAPHPRDRGDARDGRPFSDVAAEASARRSTRRSSACASTAPALYARIDARVDAMIAAGLVDEVRGLNARGLRLRPAADVRHRLPPDLRAPRAASCTLAEAVAAHQDRDAPAGADAAHVVPATTTRASTGSMPQRPDLVDRR